MRIRVFIENEAGSRTKNRYDERSLAHEGSTPVARAYPLPYGFVLDTVSGDGEALDCHVLTDRPLASGAIVECEPIGLMEQIEDGQEDHKVVAVPVGERRALDREMEARLREFARHVFDDVPGKRMNVGRFATRDEAAALIAASRRS